MSKLVEHLLEKSCYNAYVDKCYLQKKAQFYIVITLYLYVTTK